MAKTKGVRIVITLECKTSEGVYRYHTTKNRRNTPNRIELKKYCPLSKKHEIFKEIKYILNNNYGFISSQSFSSTNN